MSLILTLSSILVVFFSAFQIKSAGAGGKASLSETNYTINSFTLSASGSCRAGKVYKISAVSDFQKYLNELECLWSAAEQVDFIPEGIFHGRMISAINSKLLASMYSHALNWEAKVIRKIRCNNLSRQNTYYGWNRILRRPLAPFIATIKNISNMNLVAGEYDDGKTSLVLHYGQDLTQLCPEYRAELRQKYGDLEIRRTNFHHAFIPFIHVIDTIRFVGKRADGANIFFGKAYIEDEFMSHDKEKMLRTLSYFHLVNYDKRVKPDVRTGAALLPLERSFSYKLPGIGDVVFGALIPINQLLKSPRLTIREMIQAFAKLGNRSILYLNELLFGLSAVRQMRRDFDDEFHG